MNKNNLLILSITAIVFLGLVLLLSNLPEDQQVVVPGALGDIEVEQSFDFGLISMKEGDVFHEFVLKNTGLHTVLLSRLYTSCMCTTARLKMNGYQSQFFGMVGHGYIPKVNKVLEPGEEAVIEVVFDPAAHGPAGVGRVERIVYVEGEKGTMLQVQFFATITP